MDIQKLDKNFAVQTADDGSQKDLYTIPRAPFSLYGVTFSESEGRFVRMPHTVAANVSEGVKNLALHTAGGRLRFTTDSAFIEIHVSYPALTGMSHMAYVGQSGFILLEETDDGISPYIRILPPGPHDDAGYTARVETDGKRRDYILHFPLYNEVSALTVALSHGAYVGAGKPYRKALPILYYGSSITQGGCASRPDTAYQGIIAHWNNIDFINLGFSGNAKGEQVMADYLSGIPCSAFVCDYDHNAPSVEHLRNTHYKLYETFRKRQPTTPVLFLTKPDCDHDPTAAERRAVIRKTYTAARKNGDENVHYLDGRKLFGRADRNLCAVDGCHPTDLGFYRMAQAVYKELVKIDGMFR